MPAVANKERAKEMRIRQILIVITAVLILTAGDMGSRALALEAGSYVVSNTTYYVNPDTGVSDDGGDTSTGEGMCRNATYPDCLYEFKDGKHYVTVRIKLISFIKNIRFNVQGVKGDSNSYQAIDYTVTGENKEENTKDFRLELPAADVLIKPAFFVGPMNRDVTYFMGLNLGTAQKDNGSFAAFNQAAANTAPAPDPLGPAATAENQDAASPASSGQPAPVAQEENNSGQAAQKAETNGSGNAPSDDATPGTGANDTVKEETPTNAPGDEPAAVMAEETDEIIGIVEYSAAGEAMAQEPATGAEAPAAGGSRPAVWAVVAGLGLAAGGGAYMWIKKRA